MKALVTGAAGFIGSHLTDLLLARGIEVTGLDSFATSRTANLRAAERNPRFRLVKGDIRDPQIAGAFEGVDWVFHLAGLADIVPSSSW